jgi:hypothetical protein
MDSNLAAAASYCRSTPPSLFVDACAYDRLTHVAENKFYAPIYIVEEGYMRVSEAAAGMPLWCVDAVAVVTPVRSDGLQLQ